ncbi:MAG TPA: ATP-binding protein [Polyangiales bacterium]|nr:ATP-binding protein [Polyangiales bacterium]
MREDGELDALRREVVALRSRVAELQRAAARHEETEGISLAEREELLHEAERVAHLGTWTWDVGSGRVTWSEELHRILGLEPGSLVPSVEAFFARVHPEDQVRVQTATDESIRAGILPLIDCRVVRPDGSIRHTTHSSSMLFDATGTPRRIVGGVLDRTESLQVENKLRRTLALLEEAQRFAQLGSWRLDPRSGELEWSDEFRNIAGLPADVTPNVELFFERVVPEDRERFRVGYAEQLVQLEGGPIAGRLRRPDGQVRHVQLEGYPVMGVDRQMELRGTMLDVTDQVRMREELVHAQKMEAVGRLAGGIAHDFNNLLTVVTGNLELLGDRIGPVTELEDSLRAMASATSLTRRLLAFGRKAQLSLRVVEPNELVRSTMALMHRLVGDEVKLEIELAPELPHVHVDPLEIERALVNLVVNARDAMPGGGIVRIGTATRRANGALQVEISVEDEGPGIAEADRTLIFEPFYTTRHDAGGTGLGLATVLGTAEQHGGTVRVTARPGGGSIFTIVLPAVEPATAAGASAAETDSGVRPARRLELLVIDDEPMIADVARRILESRGHRVRVASEPHDVLALWATHGSSIDLVICDVVMTQMRGPELIARLAEAGATPRVLFITGYSEEAVHSDLGHPVLAKPFTASSLVRAIEEVLVHTRSVARNER